MFYSFENKINESSSKGLAKKDVTNGTPLVIENIDEDSSVTINSDDQSLGGCCCNTRSDRTI